VRFAMPTVSSASDRPPARALADKRVPAVMDGQRLKVGGASALQARGPHALRTGSSTKWLRKPDSKATGG
jgi:hypothetical protein